MRQAWRALGLVAAGALLVLAGCSGSGGTTHTQGGVVRGTVNLGGASPASLNVLVDGRPVNVHIGSNGAFAVPGLPAGEHVVDVVSDDGMNAGRATVVADDGSTVDIEDPIDLEGAGQIAGFVVKQIDGAEEPLAKVEVVARGGLVWIMTGGGQTLTKEGSTDAQPLIYPPPEGEGEETYSAFTGDDGSYLMKGVKPGSYLVAVTVPGLTVGEAWVYVDANRTAVADLQLREAIEPGVGTIEGTVTGQPASGDPVALEGAVVSLSYPDGGYEPASTAPAILGTAQAGDPGQGDVMPPDIIWEEFRTLTDQAGHYSLNVPSGYASVSAWADGYSWEGADVTIQPRETLTQDFLLTFWEDVVEPPDGGGAGGDIPVPPQSR